MLTALANPSRDGLRLSTFRALGLVHLRRVSAISEFVQVITGFRFVTSETIRTNGTIVFIY